MSKVRLSRRLVRAALAGVSLSIAGVGGTLIQPDTASASPVISGQVTCVDELNVEGVWIQASNGGSGYASRTNVNGYTQNFSYNLPYGGAWTVHVGCGGSSSHWKYTPDGSTTTTNTYQAWTCITPDDGTGQNYCEAS